MALPAAASAAHDQLSIPPVPPRAVAVCSRTIYKLQIRRELYTNSITNEGPDTPQVDVLIKQQLIWNTRNLTGETRAQLNKHQPPGATRTSSSENNFFELRVKKASEQVESKEKVSTDDSSNESKAYLSKELYTRLGAES
ncbi:hypothetical protein EVAR_2362_1 [Eumeta japonica]|uniref:Uncharacterized protein n=1 Tax=Eumeta variegata TaxID=151549 RepID=A0A4C1SGH5_EUMVA|nr:hypothetical protein EVAR_2362_1 [Eumeta japonica]